MTFRLVLYLGSAACCVAAAHRRAWPLASLFFAGLAANAARAFLLPLPSPVPLHLAALDSAAFLCWPAALAEACIATLTTAPAWPVLPAYLAAVGAALLLPAHLAAVYTAAELAAGAACVLAAAGWALSRADATRARVACAVLAVGHPVVVLGGAYRVDLWARWDLHRAGYLVLLTAVLLILAIPRSRRG